MCVQVVSENVPWAGGVVAISNFGFGGTNVHCILEGQPGGCAVSSLHPLSAGPAETLVQQVKEHSDATNMDTEVHLVPVIPACVVVDPAHFCQLVARLHGST